MLVNTGAFGNKVNRIGGMISILVGTEMAPGSENIYQIVVFSDIVLAPFLDL
jgi:hypothetical protein